MSNAGETVGRGLIIPLPPRRNIYLRIEELPDDQTPPHPEGRLVLLARPSAYVFQVAQAMDAATPGSTEYMTALYDLGAALLPKLPRSDVDRVSALTLLQILDVFQKDISELEEIAKNAGAPLAEAPKGSNSRTPSPTRSRKSPRGTASRSTS